MNEIEITAICPIHGEYTAKTAEISLFGNYKKTIATGCPICITEKEQAEKAEKKTRLEKQNRELLENAGITPRFLEADFDNYTVSTPNQQTALDACKDYAARAEETSQTGENLLLIGGLGTGKNHLATGIVKGFLRTRKTVRLIKLAKLLRQIRETYSPKAKESESQILDRLKALDLLILDEVGVKAKDGATTESDKALLYEIVDDRYENIKPTILISNLNKADLDAYLAEERVIDRLKGAKIILFDWKSFRK
jgi:DNA replication protein DnaC